jgi:hypothetical protein
MATDAEVRRALKDAGQPVPERGKLGQDYYRQYAELTGDDAAAAGPDLPGPGSPDGESSPGSLPGSGSGERRPRRATPRGRPKSLWQRMTSQGGGRRGRARHGPRVPVDRLCERGWEFLARMAGPTPLGRCLSMQSPVAGLVMEDIVAGTMVDRALQPIARAEQRSEKVLALFGPPLIVAALQSAQGLPDEQRQLREAFLVPMLRECMVLGVDIAADKIKVKAERDAEMGPAYAQADELIAMIFNPPSAYAQAGAEAEAAEQAAADDEAAARNAQAFAVG